MLLGDLLNKNANKNESDSSREVYQKIGQNNLLEYDHFLER